MKKKISLILAFVFLLTAALPLTQLSFNVSAATADNADFKMTAPDGTVTYHNATEFTGNSSVNPTYPYCSGTAVTTLEMLRNVTHNANFWIFGNVVLDGQNDTNKFVYTYTGSDYAFCTASNNLTGLGNAKPAESAMRTAKIINLTLVAKCENPSANSTLAGCLKFYNSILHLGEGNNFKTENIMLLTPTEHGKFIVSGGYYESHSSRNMFEIGGDRTSGGKTYYSTVNAEISGGEFYSPGTSIPVLFRGSAKNSTTINITGGTFRTAYYDAVKILNGTLNINGGDYTGDIVAEANATVNVLKKLSQGIIVKGSGKINVPDSANMQNPIVAEIYVDGSATPYKRLTRSELVYYLRVDSSNNITRYDSNIYKHNVRIELVDNVYTYDAQIGTYVYTSKTINFNGNGKTIFGKTIGDPILRGYGSSAASSAERCPSVFGNSYMPASSPSCGRVSTAY